MRFTNEIYHATLALCIMAMGAGSAWWLTPTQNLAEKIGPPNLEKAVPLEFSDWHVDGVSMSRMVTSPGALSLLKMLYRETLTRIYVNGAGKQIMLSIAYGDHQRDGLSIHYPEVCYPAQGFKLVSRRRDEIHLPFGQIPLRRLEMVLDNRRYEPVTYWTMIGEHSAMSALQRKRIQFEYSADNLKIDALLFRVSSIDADSNAAFALQDEFIVALMNALDAKSLKRLSGLSRVSLPQSSDG